MLFRLIYIAGAFCLALNLMAQPAPKLNSISRSWMQRGASTDVVLRGENLAGATRILISGGAGVEAEITPAPAQGIKVESAGGGIVSVAPRDDKQLRVALKLAPDAALVERELRVVTDAGVSNPVRFRASSLPEIESRRDNLEAEKAQTIDLPAAVNGVISSAAESDFFRFKAKSGEQLVFDCYAQRLGGSGLDSSLAILDAGGKELARNEDARGLDSVLTFSAPADGEYFLQVRDFRYQGGGDYRYRILAGTLPHVTRIFPFGGQRGQTVTLDLEGVNLGNTSKLMLHLAPDAAGGRQEIRAATGRGLSNPFLFEVGGLPEVSENPTNEALRVPIPAAINGRLEKEGDSDAFEFKAEKDQRIVFDVDAFVFGSPADALLTLMDAQGNVLQRNDDAEGADARIDHRFGAAGEYRLVIRDLLERGGKDFGYRIRAVTPPPDFSAVFLPDTPRVRKGGRVPVRVEVNRSNGFNEAVTVHALDLPPGLHAEPLLIPAGSGSGLLLIPAGGDAVQGSFPLRVIVRGTIGGTSTERFAQPISGETQAQEAFVTVLESAPFAILSPTVMARLEQNAGGTIEVIVERRNGFDGEIKVVPEGFSAGREPIMKHFEFEPLVLKPGETRGQLALKARLDAEIAARPIVLKAETTADGTPIAEYSALIPVATAEIPFVLSTSLKRLVVTALPPDSDSAAGEAVFEIRAQRRGGFAAPIELKLEGVPAHVVLTMENIPENSGATTVRLVASENAPAGKEFQLTITGTGIHNDRFYRFSPAPVTLTINAPEAAPVLAGSN